MNESGSCVVLVCGLYSKREITYKSDGYDSEEKNCFSLFRSLFSLLNSCLCLVTLRASFGHIRLLRFQI